MHEIATARVMCLSSFAAAVSLPLQSDNTLSTIPLNSCLRRRYRCYNSTLTRKVLLHISSPFTYFITQHIRHLTDERLENTSSANALMLMPDKLKSPDCVEHEPFLVSRPEGSTRKMQLPKRKTAKAPNPHRYRGLYLQEVSKETREGLRE